MISKTMRAVLLQSYDGQPESVTVGELPVPQPGLGEVLIRVAASPINPSDLAFLVGKYGFKKPLPAVPGFEGSGRVVATGSGTMSRFLSGKRVACTVADPKIPSGMWAEYAVTSANLCIPLAKNITMEQGAMMLVNPLSAWAMVDEARRAGHKAIVQTAAASALGKMVFRLGKRFRMPVINIVRRADQVETLKGIGAQYVLDSSSDGFDSQLKHLCNDLSATIGLDAVAGELTGRVLRALPKGSRMFVYGALSIKDCEIDPGSLIFEGKVLAGFWISAWLARKSLVEKIRIARKVQQLLGDELRSDIQAAIPIADTVQAIARYMKNMTAGKVLLIP